MEQKYLKPKDGLLVRLEDGMGYVDAEGQLLPLPVVAPCPRPPAPPARLMKPLPEAGSYSATAQKNMQDWQK